MSMLQTTFERISDLGRFPSFAKTSDLILLRTLAKLTENTIGPLTTQSIAKELAAESALASKHPWRASTEAELQKHIPVRIVRLRTQLNEHYNKHPSPDGSRLKLEHGSYRLVVEFQPLKAGPDNHGEDTDAAPSPVAVESESSQQPPPPLVAHTSNVSPVIGSLIGTLFAYNLKRSLGGQPPTATIDLNVFPDLIDSLRSGACVLMEGPALLRFSNHPDSRRTLCERLLEWATGIQLIDENDVDRLKAEIEAGVIGPVLDLIADASRNSYSELVPFLASLYPPSTEDPHKVYSLLSKLPFGGVIGSSFGDSLELVFSQHTHNRPVSTPSDTESLVAALTNQEFFVLKLFGSLDRPESVKISDAQFTDEIINENLAFTQFLESLFVSRSVIFVGLTLDEIDESLRTFRIRGKPTRKHYAIAPVGNAWTTKANLLQRRFGLETLNYPEDKPDTLVTILKYIAEQLGPTTVVRRHQTQPIQRIILENIGPFESLDLELNPSWNLFLGNNGVGKSTILRALALALCGRDAEQYAGRIMRTGSTTSSIVIQTSNATYRTLLQRTTTSIEISSSPIRPLEPEGWLALAFPPLRTASGGFGNTSEPSEHSLTSDILPILRSEADGRLENLRNWIVNLDHRIARDRSPNSKYKGLISKFFDIVSDLTEGVTLRFGSVNPETRQVTVITDDGEVPLDYVSQGTASLISWIGVILQRFYETFGAEADPTSKYALILMDEIDAHMHPRWQQILINRLQKHFPKVQFLVTTHSPLIVSNIDAGNVSLVWRDPHTKKISVRAFQELNLQDIDYERILTGPLFGLPDSRSLTTQQREREYLELIQLHNPTTQQIALRKQLAASLLNRRPSTVSPQLDAQPELDRPVAGSVASKVACFMIAQLLRQYLLVRISDLIHLDLPPQGQKTLHQIAANLDCRSPLKTAKTTHEKAGEWL